MPEFAYQSPFPLGPDATRYRLLSSDYVSVAQFEGQEILKVAPRRSRCWPRGVSRRRLPLSPVAPGQGRGDPRRSRGLAQRPRRGADAAPERRRGVRCRLPMCQDTGTAIIVAKKGQRVWTGVKDEEWLARGIFETYRKRESALLAGRTDSRCTRRLTRGPTCRPRSISRPPRREPIEFLFVAKGGGSANKSMLFQETQALLNPANLEDSSIEKLRSLGTAACPPYHLAVVVGGTSAEATMKTMKLASTGYLDNLPTMGTRWARRFATRMLEEKVLELARQSGIGAQFGGKYFALDARVIRLPRHGASCPVGIGVSCSADRNLKARIDRDGTLDRGARDAIPPASFPHSTVPASMQEHGVPVGLDRPMSEILAELSRYPSARRSCYPGPSSSPATSPMRGSRSGSIAARGCPGT